MLANIPDMKYMGHGGLVSREVSINYTTMIGWFAMNKYEQQH